jgi:DNA recombination protein Rad52
MKTLSPDQIKELTAPLSRESVRIREQGGRSVSYVEGWHVIAEANRILGYDGWSSETIDVNCVDQHERPVGKVPRSGWGVTYTARCRITVLDGLVFRDGVGAGHGIDVDLGQAHESAIKEAETDARKRALMTFGNQFGLALYDKTQANVADEPTARDRFIAECNLRVDSFDPAKDDPKNLLIWWNDPNQHKSRDDFLNPAERLDMHSRLRAKLGKR